MQKPTNDMRFKIDITAGDTPCKDGNNNDGAQESVWLSYELLGKISQSDIFSGSNFPPLETEFSIDALEDLYEWFGNKELLCIYICSQNSLLGVAKFNLVDAFVASKANGQTMSNIVQTKRVVQTCFFETAAAQSEEEEKTYGLSSIKVGLTIQEYGLEDRTSATATHICPPTMEEVDRKEKRDEEKRIQLKQQNFEAWRHQQEVEWLQKLQKKEASMLQAVEEQVATMKNESLLASEASRKEYDQLVARLRKGIMDVQSKESSLKDLESNLQNEFKRRMAELDTRERLNREEIQSFKDVRCCSCNCLCLEVGKVPPYFPIVFPD